MAHDPHRLRPDHLPTPFSADEIRAGCPAGRTIRMLVTERDREPYVHVTRFVATDEIGAEQESWEETEDGRRLSEPRRRRSTWLDFQGHASMPASSTTIDHQILDIPAGRHDCLVYRRVDGDTVMTFWFATTAPGMPLRFEHSVRGELVDRSIAIEDRLS